MSSSRSRAAAVELALTHAQFFENEAPKVLQWLGRVSGFEYGPNDHRAVELAFLVLRSQRPTDPLVGIRPGQPDSAYDGAWVGRKGTCYRGTSQLDAVPATKPSGGAKKVDKSARDELPPRVIYVNGVRSRIDKHAVSLSAIANTLGTECVGLHVASEGPNLDLLTAMAQKLRLRESAAVTTLAQALSAELRESDRPIRLIAHSLGAVVVAQALQQLSESLPPGPERDEILGRIEVTTMGGAQATFPDGPQYLHLVNERDPVAMRLGVGSNPDRAGRGARIVRFQNDGDGGLLSRHGLMECYLVRLSPTQLGKI